MRGLGGNFWVRAPFTLFLSDILLNIGIFVWNARDQVLTIYSADPMFVFRCLLIGVAVSLPLVVILEALNAMRTEVMQPIFAVLFIIIFFASLVIIQRYWASYHTGFLAGIDNIWLQLICVYVLSLCAAGIVLLAAMRVAAKISLMRDRIDRL